MFDAIILFFEFILEAFPRLYNQNITQENR